MVLGKANIETAMAICFIDLTKTQEKRNEALGRVMMATNSSSFSQLKKVLFLHPFESGQGR